VKINESSAKQPHASKNAIRLHPGAHNQPTERNNLSVLIQHRCKAGGKG
jgi:hypothetical protein